MKDLFYKKRWEGKPLLFKLKYLYANYPGITFSVCCFTIAPIFIYAVRGYNFEDTRLYAMKKYKVKYTVVRDDDPNLDEIIAEKELGRHHFPTY